MQSVAPVPIESKSVMTRMNANFRMKKETLPEETTAKA
jgi:hypothetical protein